MQSPFDDLIPGNQSSPLFAPRQVYRQGPPQPAPQTPPQRKKDELDVINTQDAINARPIDRADKRFTQNRELRQEYSALPLSKNFLTVTQKAAAALSADDTPQGDLAVLYAFATVQDPDSVVRESEQEMAKSTATRFEQLRTQYNMGKAGARLPKGVREGLSEQIRSNTKAVAGFYNQHRGFYTDLAKRNGFDPYEIVGPNPLETFDKTEQQYVRSRGGTPRRNGIPIDGEAPSRLEGHFGDEDVTKDAPKASDFRNQLYSAMKAGQIKSPKDMAAFQDAFNKSNGTFFSINTKSKSTHQALKAARSGRPFNVETPQDQRALKMTEDLKRMDGTGAAVNMGAGDAITFGGQNKLMAAGDAMRGAMGGEGAFGDLYGVNKQALNAYQKYLQETELPAYLAGSVGGSLAVPFGLGARTPMQLARTGAGMGMAHGAISSEGSFGDRAGQMGEEGGAGAALGGAFGLAGRALRGRMNASGAQGVKERDAQIAAAQAARDLGIDMPRFVAGGPTAQRLGALANQSQVGTPTITRASNLMLNQSEAARDQMAGRVGNVLDPESMGDTAITGIKTANRQARKSASRLYDESARMNGDQRYALPRATAIIDQQIAELSDTPGGMTPAILDTFKDVRAKLGGDWSPDGIKRMRGALSDRFIEAGMKAGDASRRAKLVVDAAEADLIQGMRASGKEAAAATLRRASAKWAEAEQFKERVIQPIIGINKEKTGAEVARGLTAAFKNNPGRASKFMAALPEEQANDVRASVISQMGNPGTGTQDAEGKAFSLNVFLTHWNDIKAVRTGIFDPQTVRALNKLALVAERTKTAGLVENRSNTGSIAIGMATAGPASAAPVLLATGQVQAAAAAVMTSVALGLAQHGGAKLLASPKFAQRLAKMPMTEAGARSFWSGNWVQKMAVANPEIREPLINFQRQMIANDNFAPSLAASPDPNEEQRQHYPY